MTVLTGEDKKSLAPVLRAAAVPLLDQDICRSSEVNGGRNQQILDSMLCAGKSFICKTKTNSNYCLLLNKNIGFLQGGIGLLYVSNRIYTKISNLKKILFRF